MTRLCLVLCVLGWWMSAQDPFGLGSPASSGVYPRLGSNQPYMGNLGFGFRLDRGVGSGAGLVALSFGATAPLPGPFPVCIDLGAPNFLFLLSTTLDGTPGAPGAGSAFLPLPLPFAPDPLVAGLQVYAQGAVSNPSIPGGDLAITNCLELELGYAPLLFVGSSVSGSNDLYATVDPQTGALVGPQSGMGFTNNVDGATFANGGLDLFVAGSLGPRVSRFDFRTSPPTPSTLYQAPSGSLLFEVGFDRRFDRIYTLVGSGSSNRQLVAIDGNPNGGTPGIVLGTTIGLTGGAIAERWAFSRTGNFAAVPLFVISAGPLLLVDTNPTSAGYLQATATTTIPGIAGALGAAVGAAFGWDDEVCVVGLSGVGLSSLARYHLPTQSWIDHDLLTPAIDNIPLPGTIPTRIALSRDGSFAYACGSGWLARIDFDRFNLTTATVTPYPIAAGLLTSADGLSISPDGSQVAVTSLSPPKVLILDATPNSTPLQNVALPGMNNLTVTAWR